MRNPQRPDPDRANLACRTLQAVPDEGGKKHVDKRQSFATPFGSVQSELKPGKVLIVEEDASVALDICDVVNEMGKEVVGLVTTEPDAVHQALERQPDLIIMDIKLKHDGSGLRASRRILAERDTAILFITAFEDSNILRELRDWPSAAVLFKPFNRSALLHAIETALGQNPH